MLGGDGEGAFQSDADAAEQSFVEEAANQSDAVRNAARRGKFGQRMLRVGRPIGARLRNFDIAGAESE